MNMNERIPLEEWKAKKQAEREALGQKQLAAMESFCGSGKALSVYLYGRGRLGSRLSSGNAALVLQQIPLARAVNPMRIWNQNGRSVNKGAKGITVLSRKGNGKGYYLTPETVFDVSQTNGDTPCPQRTIQDDPKQQSIAVLSIVEMARVPVEIGEPATGVTEYLPDEKKIVVSREATDLQLLQELPSVLVQSCLALDAPDTNPAEVRFLSGAAALEVCGRFGISAPASSDTRMEQCRHILSHENVREHFDNARDFARTIGDQIERNLPKLQYHARDTRHQPERG